jgi:predicted Ser/Thr protein kinase
VTLSPEQHRRARELFEQALEHEPANLLPWLQSAEPADDAVRAEVQSLLDHHSRAGSFLTDPILDAAPDLIDESPLLNPGSVLGTYTIERELGRGGMGRVYLARDAKLGRAVAMKALAPELTRNPVHRERLRREARAAALLSHPGICTVYALEEFDGDLYIVTEYVEGHTLREEVAGARPDADTIVATCRQLAAALAAAHANGVVHRDLKPENVMRLRDGRIKVLDFGLARADGDRGQTLTAAVPGGMAGTPAYMAPEQIEARPVGPPADVFAFGVLMYEWITGRHPFLGASSLATMARVLDSDPEPIASRSAVPPVVASVVERCLKKRPEERFASGSDLVAALDSSGTSANRAGEISVWWRVHQLTAMLLYFLASTRAWQIKNWVHSPISLWAFILMGIAASVGGIVRGHLIFTDAMNRGHVRAELRRTRPAVVFADVLMAATLTADAFLLASSEPLAAVLTICVAAGIALASLLMEPATTTAVFGRI